MSGWVRLYRDLLEDVVWVSSTPEQKAVLITILLNVNHKQTEWEWRNHFFLCQPGQLITSLPSLAAKAGVSIQNVRTAIKRFKKFNFLTDESTDKGRLITVCKWDIYQGSSKDGQQAIQQTGNRPLTTNNNYKKEKKDLDDIFEKFRKEYPGTKRGFKTEFKNFLDKNELEIAQLLLPALQKEKEHRNKLDQAKQFCPPWKNLKTWINQKCWEQEFEIPKVTNHFPYTPPKGLQA